MLSATVELANATIEDDSSIDVDAFCEGDSTLVPSALSSPYAEA